jgi:glycosyltransferase involved in cell wall biosynthesis
MHIGVDANEANVLKRVGIGQFAYQVLVHLSQIHKPNLEFEIYLKTKPPFDFPRENSNWKYTVFGPQKLWTQLALPTKLLFQKDRPRVFFSPSHYAPRFSLVPTVIAIMDLSYIYYPKLFKKKDLLQLENWTNYSVKQATKIITISEYSKRTIIDHYNIPDSKIEVVYPGVDLTVQKITNRTKNPSWEIPKRYILFVGTIQPRKNIVKLVEAFEIIKDDDLHLVIVGKKGWMYEPILDRINTSSKKQKIHWYDFVSEEKLFNLYKNAICFVLPSLYEGFGIPVIEAFSSGCPVIVSNVTSLPEITGDAALLIDPKNENDIAIKINDLLNNSKLRVNLIEKGKARLKFFDWQKCSGKILDILEEVGRKKV